MEKILTQSKIIENEILSYSKKASPGCLVTSKWGTKAERKLAFKQKLEQLKKWRNKNE